MFRHSTLVLGALVVSAVLAGCVHATPPTRQTTTTTTIACPPGKTLDSDGLCR